MKLFRGWDSCPGSGIDSRVGLAAGRRVRCVLLAVSSSDMRAEEVGALYVCIRMYLGVHACRAATRGWCRRGLDFAGVRQPFAAEFGVRLTHCNAVIVCVNMKLHRRMQGSCSALWCGRDTMVRNA